MSAHNSHFLLTICQDFNRIAELGACGPWTFASVADACVFLRTHRDANPALIGQEAKLPKLGVHGD
jgi:hypothetical protein